MRDGDHIHGTLLGVGLSNSGTGMPLKPVAAAEEACIRDTYLEFGVKPETVQYVECHATGTPQGDAAEIEAVRRVFAGHHPAGGPLVGSSKANFGHALVAAGFAGMCKLLQSMQRATIPPTPVDAGAKPIDPLVVTEGRPWPATTTADGRKVHPRRGGLSAFGFGGTNAHAIFEEFVPSLAQADSFVQRVVAAAAATTTTTTQQQQPPQQPGASIAAPNVQAVDLERAERVTLEVIAEKTGYDADMIERDASLEDDLGIDSIKRIELLSAIQDILGIEGDREALARTQTVGDVIDCLRATALAGASSSSSSAAAAAPSAVAVPLAEQSALPDAATVAACKLAIVGMAAHFGTAKSLLQFEELLYSGGDAARPLPRKRWRFLSKDGVFAAQLRRQQQHHQSNNNNSNNVESKTADGSSSSSSNNNGAGDIHGCFIESVPVNHRYVFVCAGFAESPRALSRSSFFVVVCVCA